MQIVDRERAPSRCEEETSVGPATAGSDASGMDGRGVNWGSVQPRDRRCGKRWTQSKRPQRTCLETGMSCTRTPTNTTASVSRYIGQEHSMMVSASEGVSVDIVN